MLQVVIPPSEQWDEIKEEFIYTKEQTIVLEHSLVSLSKWESKWCKPYYSKNEKSYEEIIDYIRCMTITQNVDPDIYHFLSPENIKEINDYIDAPMTATWFNENNKKIFNKQITSEIIYYWMIALNIPFECQKWHLNRLMTLIRVCEIKNQPSKKRSQKDIMSSNNALNAARRKQFNSRG